MARPRSADPPDSSQVTIEQDERVLSTPITERVWTVTSPDGHTQCSYQPITGFEHLCPSAVPERPPTGVQPPHQPTTTEIPNSSQQPQQRKTFKRSRSVARGGTQHQHIAQDFSDSEQDNEDDGEISQTFYIGNINELMKFFKRRLEELTLKPLRPIVTAWIRQLDPKRLGLYGPYHNMLPRDQPLGYTPPWWPHDVPYKEPSHLLKAEVLTLGVDIMLQHRQIDEEKRRGSWVAKLRQAAQYAVETIPQDQFSSSKIAGFNKWMKKRALDDVLPNLFDTAALYEDHLVQYDLYEGTGRTDPGDGISVTWRRLTRPPRLVTLPRKRGRRTKAAQVPRTESDVDAPGDETEVDDTLTRAHWRTRQTRQTRRQAQQPQNPSVSVFRQHAPETPALTVPASASQQDRHIPSSTTSNTSPGQHMHGLRVNEGMDAKMPIHTQHNDQLPVGNMYPSNMPMQYPTSHAGYNFPVFQDAHPFPHSAESSFGSHVPCFAQSFFVFDPMASINAGFPYEYEEASPLTPMLGDSDRPFHGLPLDPNANY